MFALRTIFFITLSFALSGVGASGCHEKPKSWQQGDAPVSRDASMGKLKVLAEGFHSSITNSFIAVVRDQETYSAIAKLEGNLPKLDPNFFKSNIAVAAFLGERNTGGYSVEFSQDASGQIHIAEKAPGKSVMVPQMITSPFKVVTVSATETAPASLSVDRAFQQRAQIYKVTSGRFRVFGGFSGQAEEFRLTGEIQTMRQGELVTVSLALKSAGASKERSLMDYATGMMKDGRLIVNKLSDGSLVDPPSGGLSLDGEFLDRNRLSLKLAAAPIMVPESYSGEGSIDAEMVSASAN